MSLHLVVLHSQDEVSIRMRYSPSKVFSNLIHFSVSFSLYFYNLRKFHMPQWVSIIFICDVYILRNCQFQKRKYFCLDSR